MEITCSMVFASPSTMAVSVTMMLPSVANFRVKLFPVTASVPIVHV